MPDLNVEDLIADLATEVWRLGRRVNASDETNDRVRDSYDRLTRVLERHEIRFDDPTGRHYVDGSSFDVVAAPTGAGSDAQFVVADVLKPAVFIGGVLRRPPQVTLALRPDEEL